MSDIIDLSSYDPEGIPEPTVHEEGTEIEARITNIIKGTDKNGDDYIMPWFEDSEDANVEDFSKYMPLPSKEATEKQNRRRLRDLVSFSECFDLPIFDGEFDLEDGKGAKGWIIVGIGKDQDGNRVNTAKKFLAGQVG